MVLQHLRQPRPFRLLCAEVREPLLERYRADHPFIRTAHQPVDRPACPRCSSTAIRRLKRAAHPWKCASKVRGRTCGFEFDTPATVKALTPEQKHARSAEYEAFYAAAREEFDKLYRDEIGKQAVLLSIEEHLRYLSLEDTSTFCKRCAFLWDRKSMRLCGDCREGWHALHLSRCRKCSTAEKEATASHNNNASNGSKP